MPSERQLVTFYETQYTETHQQERIQEQQRLYYRDHVLELARYARISAKEMSIVDVGCSFPVFLAEAVASGVAAAIGVDWSEDARRYGETHGITVLSPLEIGSTIPDESVHVLRYSHTLEHMVDPVGILQAHVRKVVPGGVVYIAQPNFPVFRYAESQADIQDSVWPNHLHFFSPISLMHLMHAAGLVIERFFSVTDPETVQQRHGPDLDLDYAREALIELARCGEDIRGALNNYPYFMGMDAATYARRLGASAKPGFSEPQVGLSAIPGLAARELPAS